jgi:hypothetical protein
MSLHTKPQIVPFPKPFGDQLYVRGDNLHHVDDDRLPDWLPVERNPDNASDYDKAEAAGKEAARKVLLDNPSLQIAVVIIGMGGVITWMLQRTSLAAAVEEYNRY